MHGNVQVQFEGFLVLHSRQTLIQSKQYYRINMQRITNNYFHVDSRLSRVDFVKNRPSTVQCLYTKPHKIPINTNTDEQTKSQKPYHSFVPWYNYNLYRNQKVMLILYYQCI